MQNKIRKIKFKDVFVKRYYKVSDEAALIIKNKLKENNLSLATASREMGVTSSYLEHFTQNDRNFREDQLRRILPFFSIELSQVHFHPIDTIHGKFITLPKESSPKLIQIIGYLLGDGTVQPRTIRFKDTNKEVLEVYQKLIEEVFNIKGRIVSQKGTVAYLLEVNSVFLSQWLKENIVLQKEEFLEKVGQLPDGEIAAFLRGIFDAEGSVNLASRQVNLRLTNEKIVRASQSLLLRLGIATSFCKIKSRNQNWKDCYNSYFSSRVSFKQFIDIVGFSSREKLKKLKSLILKTNKKKIN